MEHIDTARLIEITQGIVDRRLLNLKGEAEPNITGFFIHVKDTFRPTLAVTPANLEELWEYIRREDDIATFVLDGAAELYFRSGLSSTGWTEVHEILGSSLTLHSTNKSSEYQPRNIIDETLMKRSLDMKGIVKLLDANHWVVFCILMSFVKVSFVNSKRISSMEE